MKGISLSTMVSREIEIMGLAGLHSFGIFRNRINNPSSLKGTDGCLGAFAWGDLDQDRCIKETDESTLVEESSVPDQSINQTISIYTHSTLQNNENMKINNEITSFLE